MPTSLYFHIPFCRHRCAYCDFNTYAGQESSIPAYVQALCREIELVGQAGGRPAVGTVFFGGGTPSLLSAEQYRDIFGTMRAAFDLLPGAEISLEANPGTVSAHGLADLREIGFNRISYGVQSVNPTELRMLERIHDFADVVNAVKWSRQAGFDNLNMDLIYGLPEHTMQAWQNTVRLVAGLKPEHISAYALTLEHGTPFGRWAQKGLLPLPDPDLAADQYEWTTVALGQLGYTNYEISNWALPRSSSGLPRSSGLPGRECRHNLQYWRSDNYLGLGAGAHGYVDGLRYSNVLRIKTYIDRLKGAEPGGWEYPLSPAAVMQHRNTAREDMQELMMTGLRLTAEGVTLQRFMERAGVGMTEVFGAEIKKLTGLGLLEWSGNGDTLRLTERGRLLGNQVFMEFVG